jgi:hypothetical protein
MKNYSLKNTKSKLTLIVSAIFMILSVYSCKMLADMAPESLEDTTWSGVGKLKNDVNGTPKGTDCLVTFYFAGGRVTGNFKTSNGETVIKQLLGGTYTYQKPNISMELNWGNGYKTTSAAFLAQTIIWTDESGTLFSLNRKQ